MAAPGSNKTALNTSLDGVEKWKKLVEITHIDSAIQKSQKAWQTSLVICLPGSIYFSYCQNIPPKNIKPTAKSLIYRYLLSLNLRASLLSKILVKTLWSALVRWMIYSFIMTNMSSVVYFHSHIDRLAAWPTGALNVYQSASKIASSECTVYSCLTNVRLNSGFQLFWEINELNISVLKHLSSVEINWFGADSYRQSREVRK